MFAREFPVTAAALILAYVSLGTLAKPAIRTRSRDAEGNSDRADGRQPALRKLRRISRWARPAR